MTKRTKRDKEIARLRREIEILRAQLGTSETIPQVRAEPERSPKAPPSGAIPQTAASGDPTLLKHDLLKSGILTAIAFAILITLYFTQPHWEKALETFRK